MFRECKYVHMLSRRQQQQQHKCHAAGVQEIFLFSCIDLLVSCSFCIALMPTVWDEIRFLSYVLCG